MPQQLQDSFFRAVFQSRVAGIGVADLEARTIVACNDLLLEMLGRDRDDIEGIPDAWREVTPTEYHHLDENALRQFVERGYADPFEKEYERPDGSRVPVRVSMSGVEGQPSRVIIFAQDVTVEREARERELEARRRLEIALSAAKQGVWDWDLATNTMLYSKRAKEIYGLGANAPVTYEIIRDATHPEDYPVTSAQLERSVDPRVRDRTSYEYRIVRPDGTICWALAHGEAVFEGPAGQEKAVRYAGTLQDITDRKAAERHQQILIAELNHRVKNTLALVQALAHQTFKGLGADSAVETFSGRLAALAAAHAILTDAKWASARVRDIAEAVLRPLVGSDDGRIRLSGDEASVPPQVAVSVAMALHELATNAVKYGALSAPAGRVDLDWALSGGPEPRLRLHWLESGGPPVKKPEREGFGTRMLKRILASDLSGSVRLDFAPGGLECTIDAPVRQPGGAAQEAQSDIGGRSARRGKRTPRRPSRNKRPSQAIRR